MCAIRSKAMNRNRQKESGQESERERETGRAKRELLILDSNLFEQKAIIILELPDCSSQYVSEGQS